MKVALLGDLHIGARKASQNFIDQQNKFFKWFFCQLSNRGITNIIQLGDVFDNHAVVNQNSFHNFKLNFLDKLGGHIDFYALVGNHDIANKNSLEVNALSLFLPKQENIHVISVPQEWHIGSATCLFIPWICEGNREQVKQTVEISSARFCFGHFEFKDFYMYKGIKNEHGQDSTSYSKFDHVFSGHYHHRNQHGNITYVGTPVQYTFSEVDDVKGFTILDLETGEAEYIESPYEVFKKVYVTSEADLDKLLEESDLFSEKYIKIYVSDDSIPQKKIDKLKSHIHACGVYDLEASDIKHSNLSESSSPDLDLETVELKDSKSILDMYIDNFEDNIDKAPLKQLMYSLYTEAIHKEDY